MIGPFCAKCTTFDLKKVRKSFISWHWRVKQNLKENWLVVLIMTWEIWQILTRANKILKIGTLMTSFCLKLKMYELKTYRGVMCHNSKKWCKNWREIDLSVQNWHEEFDEFWTGHKNLHFNGLLLTKVCNIWAKKSIGEFCLMTQNIEATSKAKLTHAFKNDMRNLANFCQSMFESLKIGALMGSFYPK